MKYDAGLDRGGSSGGGESCFDPGYILRVNLIGSAADGLDVGIREEEESKVTSKIFW